MALNVSRRPYVVSVAVMLCIAFKEISHQKRRMTPYYFSFGHSCGRFPVHFSIFIYNPQIPK